MHQWSSTGGTFTGFKIFTNTHKVSVEYLLISFRNVRNLAFCRPLAKKYEIKYTLVSKTLESDQKCSKITVKNLPTKPLKNITNLWHRESEEQFPVTFIRTDNRQRITTRNSVVFE